MDIIEKLRTEFDLTETHAENIIKLLDEGGTVPFIARYRKEMTGHIDDQVLRSFSERLEYLRNLEKRKEEVKKSITEQDKLTDEIVAALEKAETMTEVEDIYRPFKQKKKTRATVAVQKGLLPLAEIILEQNKSGEPLEKLAESYINEELGVNSAKEAVQGALDIVAEKISDDAEIRKLLRRMFMRLAVVTAEFTKAAAEEPEKSAVYETYKNFSGAISGLKSYRVLALNRGEKEGFLKVKVKIDEDFAVSLVENSVIKGESPYKEALKTACADAYDRLIEPSIEREVRSVLTDGAQERAIKTFEGNLKPLLMQPPLKGKTVMGFDPGYRTGCKVAVVDETGKVLDKTVVYPTIGTDHEKDKTKIKALIDKYGVNVISIGNGTASKESEVFIAHLIKDYGGKVQYIVVSEAGASVYSASELGAQEFPDFDVSERSAVSIARRLQDPLAELIKIDPKSIGVGQYQHDMPAARLDQALDGVLEDCVTSVGVDVNTASPSLLTHVSGLNAGIAKNIVAYREEHGKFKNRKQLLKVAKLGEKAFLNAAGFLRVAGGDNVLDNTAVHPESYSGAEKLLNEFGYTEADVVGGNLADLPQKVKQKGYAVVAESCGLGEDTLKDVLTEILKPGRDVRDDLPKPVLRADLMSLSDLKPGMVLKGTVRNVTDFGAFIDIGVHQDGLVHVSEISNKFVSHPSSVLKVGESVQVKVLGVDEKKNRISLTMKNI